MRTLIEDHMKQTKEKRQQHLDLNTDCIEMGGNSIKFQGLLAGHLNTTFPERKTIHLAHACHNGKCSNPLHLYWGTPKENVQDMVSDKNGSWKNPYDRMVEKYGKEKANAMNSHPETAHLGGEGNKGILKKDEHKKKISESLNIPVIIHGKDYPSKKIACEKLNISYRQLQKIL